MVAIVEVIRFGFGWISAGRGSPGLHDDGPITVKLDLLDRKMRGLGCTKDAADNTLMMNHFSLGHRKASVKTTELTKNHYLTSRPVAPLINGKSCLKSELQTN
jgi:hypothetical protein